MQVQNFFKNFRELTRTYAIGTTAASCLVILAYSYFSESFSYIKFILLFLALLCVHLGANLYDDYIDIRNKLKQGCKLNEIHFESFDAKARLILNGTYSLRQVEWIVSILFLLASIIGIYFVKQAGIGILFFMIIGGLLTLFYPVSSKYYLSEIIIGLIYGPLMINGGYFAICGNFNYGLFLMSFAIFFTTLVLLHVHNLMDYEFDIKNGKNTLCIFLKDKNKAVDFLRFLIFMSYSIIVYGVLIHEFSPCVLYVFLTLPIAVRLIDSAKEYIEIKDVKFEPKWYFGPFENWREIQKQNIAFYMYRLYLARNYLFFFALFILIGTFM